MNEPYYQDNAITLHHGDCLDVLPTLPDASVDSVVTDPPYELGFMGKGWDATGIAYNVTVWRECLRVLKPGGHLLAFGGTRTWHRLAVAVEDAGFDIRDSIAWLYGCLSEDTEVLINGEWAQYHKAKVGDLALCYNKEYDTYEWQPIEDTHKYEYSDTAYRIHSNNTDQIVSRNHRVLVERSGAYEFEYAENLAREHQIRVPILESLPTLLNDLSMREPLPSGEEQILQRELRNVRPSTGGGETDGATRNDRDCMCSVRDESIQAERLVEANENTDVFESMQREVARGRVEGARTQGSRSVVGGNESAVLGESARGEQPGMEGRGYLEEGARELQGCPVCSVPSGVSEHVAEGRVRNGAPSSGGEGYGASFAANRSGAPCESRTGGQSVGEPVSVRIESGPQAVRGARYTVADLADIEPVHYEGIVWCLTVPTGAFIVRRNGKVFVTGNSGFPKSLDVSKAIDKAAGAEREVVGIGGKSGKARNSMAGDFAGEWDTTAPATPDAERWQGWGTALKPAFEPVVVARKPLIGTVAQNVLAHGTGALNIDACRVGDEERVNPAAANKPGGASPHMSASGMPQDAEARVAVGRWPANVVLDESQAEALDEQSGVSKSPPVGSVANTKGGQTIGTFSHAGRPPSPNGHGDSGGASRFFYIARKDNECPSSPSLSTVSTAEMSSSGEGQPPASAPNDAATSERHDTGKQTKELGDMDLGDSGRFMYVAKAPKKERPVIDREDGTKVQHPTVKPLKLMRWLVRLITPPGGTVLDPFAGSGTTAEACVLEGFQCVAIEREADYLPLIMSRLGKPAQPGLNFGEPT